MHDSDHIEDIFSQYAETEYEEVKRESNEHVYKSKQFFLGKSYSRGHVFPEYMKNNNFRHGVKSAKSDDDAKRLIYPTSNGFEDIEESKHNDSDKPGEQQRRNYNWGASRSLNKQKSMDSSDRGSSKGVHDSLKMDIDTVSRSDLRISLIQGDVFLQLLILAILLDRQHRKVNLLVLVNSLSNHLVMKTLRVQMMLVKA